MATVKMKHIPYDYIPRPYNKSMTLFDYEFEDGFTGWHDSLYSGDDSVLPTLTSPGIFWKGDYPTGIVLSNTNFTEIPVEQQVFSLSTWQEVVLFIVKALIMGTVILTSVLGNLLVIVSVARYHKLRVLTNYFVVSMALADTLVALMAMIFNASVQLTGIWNFGSLMCDLWNSMDVYFSTVSILHLCCISIDRYTAIVQPLDYPLRMTKRTVACMLAVAWISPVSISVLPIFLGWYTTQEQLTLMAADPNLCEFKVNLIYALVSSSMSFWIPGFIMLVMYYRIYREADRQEMMVFRSTVAALLLNKHLHINGMSRGSVKITDNTKLDRSVVSCSQDPLELEEQTGPLNPPPKGGDMGNSDDSTPSPSPGGTPQPKNKRMSKKRFMGIGIRQSSVEGRDVISSASGGGVDREVSGKMPIRANNTKRKNESLNKMKRERKAAKTLGIIVSTFLLCWLPFFTWYLVSSLCGDHCQSPELLVTILFWIGYFNSTLNPIIYAYFNRDFRKAFRKTLQHYYGVCGCKQLVNCTSSLCSCPKSCTTCLRSVKCSSICPLISRGDDSPSSEFHPRSGMSSDFVHIEMTAVERRVHYSQNTK